MKQKNYNSDSMVPQPATAENVRNALNVNLPLKAWITAISFLLLTVFTLPVFAADYYVATTGNDAGAGTSSDPYKTIRRAASRATPGTTIYVQAGTYIEDNINPPSGTEDAMIVFRPIPGAEGQVIIKYNDAKYANDNAYTVANKDNNNGTDVFNLWQRNYIRIEGFRFEDYKYARTTININGNGNVVINCQFKNLGCKPSATWWWVGGGCICGGVTIPIAGGSLNVVRNNYFQSIYGEITSQLGSNNNIILENTFIGGKGKDNDANSTLGARFANNLDNVFAYNYCAGSESGRTIWIDVDVNDFLALRNEAYNTADFMLDESGSLRNWAYENICYNLPIVGGRMQGVPEGQFNNFTPQTMNAGLCTAFWDTGSTWDAKWVNNVSYNVKNGFVVERSWRHEVRNNIGYEDANGTGTNIGFKIYECAIDGLHPWHGIDLKGGGPHIIKNNLWFSTKRPNFVHYMAPYGSQLTNLPNATTVNNYAVAINSATELGVNPMFENAAAGDFRLKPGSPAIGSGYNGVDRGAYAVYPKTPVGFNKYSALLADVNLSFSKLYTSAKAGNTVNIEVKLNKPATKAMSFEIVPTAGDARLNSDFRFLDGQTLSFAVGERTKTIGIEILANPSDEIDQLLALRISPVDGSTISAEVGPLNLHLIRIIRVTKYSVTLNDVGDAMGRSVVAFYKPGETVTIDAKTRPNYKFSRWNTGYHYYKQPLANANSAVTTFIMPERNVTLQAEWNLVGARVQATRVAIAPSGTISMAPGGTTDLTATVNPEGATNKAVIWTSSAPWIAKVDQNGVVTGVSSGQAIIKVTVAEIKSGSGGGATYTVATKIVTVSPASIPAGLKMRTDGYYTFKNANSGRYLGVQDNSVAIQGETDHNFDAKTMWKLTESTAPDSIGYYTIHSVANESLVLDVTEGATDDGTKIGLLTYDDAAPAKQQFKFTLVSPVATNNTYTIRARAIENSGVEVPNSSTEADVELELKTIISTGKNQQWIAEFHESTPAITLTPAAVTFPAEAPGYTTAPEAQTITVTNASAIPNIATGEMTVALGGPNSDSFTLSTISLANIAEQGGTGTFTVQPKAGLSVGTHMATVTVSGTGGLTEKTATVTFVVALPTAGFYAIKNVNSGRYLTVSGTGAGSNVTQNATALGSVSNNLWKLQDAGNGYYNIHSKANDGVRMDVNAGNSANGERIIVWNHNDGNNQKFKIVEVTPGIYTIRTGLTNDASCIEVSNASTTAGAQVVQWAVRTGGSTAAIQSQQWILEYQDGPTELQLGSVSTIVVYPNPTSGELKISTEGMGDNEKIEIFNIMGSLVESYPCDYPDTTIDISHLTEGVYFLKINGETIKVIKK